ncbi:MAG: branched-chain amino acid transport system ATP-binding protein [Chloroflexota bacterium]|nr:branched-chain amino acid transport system ATP-binding protein [Chloroflexota bacterium]
MSLLKVEHAGIAFGGVRALSDVSLELNRGEILGLIGPNGAGKTTLFNLISGVLVPDRGQILFDDKQTAHLKPHERAQLGIARTFQNLQLWKTMTVLENCMTPQDALRGRNIVADALRLPGAVRAEHEARERGEGILHALDLLEHADELAGDLPVGLQRRVELARALCMRPRLLLLDEPASGLDATETEELAGLLRRIRDRFQVSILLVDHDMSLVMRACHFIYVLDFGEMISAGRPEQVRDDPKVIAAYLGDAEPAAAEREVTSKDKKSPAKPARRAGAAVTPEEVAAAGSTKRREALLEVHNLGAGYGGIQVIRDVKLTVGKGEVVACIGANGAGKTTTLRAISGVIRPTSGKVIFNGIDITRKPAEWIVGRGMLHVPQGRGLFPKLSVEETFRLAAYSGSSSDNYDAAFDAFPVLKERRAQLVGTLSGGQQQMVAMARALLVKPELLLVDEMSQGLAPLVVQQLFEHITLFKDQGIAVLLVEQFVDSALSVADRAYIFEQGTIVREADAAELRRDQAVIAGAYLGTAAEVDGVAAEAPVLHADLLDELTLKLPAEIKRALEERAIKEGKDKDELAMELLAGRIER